MSEAHRRLMDQGALPSGSDAGPSPLPRDLRSVKTWLSGLPWANPDVTFEQLLASCVDLAGRGGVAPPDRLAAAEALRAPALEVIAIVSRRFIGVPLPLPQGGVAAARRVEGLHRALADAYRRAGAEYCVPAGKIPMLRSGKVSTALERACFHYGQALAVAWSTYRDPVPGSWQGLYRSHHFSESVGLADKPPGHPSTPESATPHQHLVRALLVALANPYAFDQDDQALLWRVAAEYAGVSTLRAPGSDGGDAPATAPVPVDADRGPGGLVDDPAQWLELHFPQFHADVESAVERHDGDPTAQPALGRGRSALLVSMAMTQQIRRAFGQRSARQHARIDGGHELEIVVGLAGLHFHLAGHDFEEFVRQSREHVIQIGERAGWAQSGADGGRAPLVRASVLDQSLGGYRLGVRDETLVRARVGEVVGLSWRQQPGDAAQERDWLVGLVRWLRYDDEGGVVVGVELLSRRAQPVALQPVEGQAVVRSIRLPASTVDTDGHFLVSSIERPAGPLQLLGRESNHGADADRGHIELATIASAGEYLLLADGAARVAP